MRVTGRVVHARAQLGHAEAKIELEGTTAEKVKEMFLTRPAADFFPSAKTWFQQRTKAGGQQFLENPLLPVPIMFTTIDPTERGAKGEFVGMLNGEAPLHIYDKDGKTYIEEVKTQVHPMTPMDLPPYRMMEAVPFFGAFAKGMHKATDAVLGTPLAMVHAALVSRDNAQTIVRTLNAMQGTG